jgi:hypothetical protein
MSGRHGNANLIERLYGALNAKDGAAMADCYALDATRIPHSASSTQRARVRCGGCSLPAPAT